MTPDVAPAVLAEGVSKTFKLPRERVHTLKERALHPLRRPGHDPLHALRDVSFEVGRGEFFGIVGRNGSGKSTLLKCLAGIYATDRGSIYIDGRVSTFIELGVGFNPDLPARDNVMINATMLGLSPREARRRFDSVIDFAELHDFIDLKLKNYSSGMLVRLAFSVMIQVDADILLIDEVLAVGDAAFQQKCFDEFARIRASGSTVLLVTHDMPSVQRFCDRAMLLERGRIVELGDPDTVGSRYLELNFSERARAEEADAPAAAGAEAEALSEESAESPAAEEGSEILRFGDGAATIIEGWFEDGTGARTELLRNGDNASFAFRVRFHRTVRDPLFGVILNNSRQEPVLIANNADGEPSGLFEPGDEVCARFGFPTYLAQDRYVVDPGVAYSGGALRWIDHPKRFATVMVVSTRSATGLLDVPVQLEIERYPAPRAQERVT